MLIAVTILYMPIGWWFRHIVLEREAFIVEALRKEDNVGQGIVHGENDLGSQLYFGEQASVTSSYHCGKNALQDGSKDVENISDQPYHNEDDRKSFCRTSTEIFKDLRREDDHPAGN